MTPSRRNILLLVAGWALGIWIVGAQVWYYLQFRALLHSFGQAFHQR